MCLPAKMKELANSVSAAIAIGFSTRTATLSRPVGWEPESYAYHGDDGRAFSGHNVGKSYSSQYNKGDIVGAGINFKTNTVFFTRNGKYLGKKTRPCPYAQG